MSLQRLYGAPYHGFTEKLQQACNEDKRGECSALLEEWKVSLKLCPPVTENEVPFSIQIQQLLAEWRLALTRDPGLFLKAEVKQQTFLQQAIRHTIFTGQLCILKYLLSGTAAARSETVRIAIASQNMEILEFLWQEHKFSINHRDLTTGIDYLR